MMHMLDSRQPGFDAALCQLLAFETAQDPAVDAAVADIIASVQSRGDAALIDYTARFDRLSVPTPGQLELSQAELDAALHRLPAATRAALEAAAERVRRYHERQLMQSWSYVEEDGTRLGQQGHRRWTAWAFMCPAARRLTPSSVLMNAIPAKVAGVGEIIMVVPDPWRRAQRHSCWPPRALPAWTACSPSAAPRPWPRWPTAPQTIPAVDKITGPGNAYVAAAKRRVFGVVGIDMVAGPSEILVICDGQTDPDWIAMDLFSQAEHDEIAQAILLCPDAEFIARVQRQHRAPAARDAAPGHHPRTRCPAVAR